MPIAEIKGARRGASRSGRYAIFSIVAPYAAQITPAAIIVMSMESGRDQRGHAGSGEEAQQDDPQVRPQHVYLAVREVDKLQYAVHHRVPERDKGIYRAHRQAVNNLLQQ